MPNRSARTLLVAIPGLERANNAISLYLAAQSDLDVSQAEAHVLWFLHKNSGARIGEIHEAFGHHRSTLTSVLDRLERRALVERAVDPENRRSVIVSLTSKGQALAKRVYTALRSLETSALKQFSEREIETFAKILEAFSAE